MKQFTITICLPDDACCPSCLRLIDIDEEEIQIYVGECEECGEEIILMPDADGIQWGGTQ